jgi:hypothetical protein
MGLPTEKLQKEVDSPVSLDGGTLFGGSCSGFVMGCGELH